MKEAGHTQSSLARALGLTRASVSFWLNGQTKEISGDNLLKAAAALNVDPAWLAMGRRGKEAPGRDAGLPVENDVSRESQLWPFSIDRSKYDQLSGRDREVLNAIVEIYVARCLAAETKSAAPDTRPDSISGIVGKPHTGLRKVAGQE